MSPFSFRAATAFFLCLASGLAGASSPADNPASPPSAPQSAPASASCPLPVALRTAPFSYTEDLTRPHAKMLPHGHSDRRILAYVRAVFANTSAIETPSPGCEQLVITAGYAHVSLVIAKELVSDPCSVNRLRAHELSHIAVYQSHLATLQARAMAAILSRHPSLEALRQPGALAQAAPSLQALVQTELETVIEANRLIDEEHEGVSAHVACEWDMAQRVIFDKLSYRRRSG